MEQVRECRDKGYLLSSKIGSGTFSKVYLAYAMHQSMKHNRELASDLVLELAGSSDLWSL